jgi:hypothetical protein
MGGFVPAPTFDPPQPPIAVGSFGETLQVLASGRVGFGAGGGGGGGIGSYLKVAPAAGSYNNYNPAGFGSGVGRLDVDTSAGIVTLTGIQAQSDGQLLNVRCVGANVLNLTAFSGLSLAGNQIALPASAQLPQWGAILLIYYAGNVNNWVMA